MQIHLDSEVQDVIGKCTMACPRCAAPMGAGTVVVPIPEGEGVMTSTRQVGCCKCPACGHSELPPGMPPAVMDYRDFYVDWA